jgi:WD40 repeat protein
VVTLLVIFSITVFLLNNYGLISDHDAEVVDVLVTLLFIAEFAFRLRCYVYVEHGVLSFFNFGKHPLNVVDFCVVVVDLALLAAASITNMGSTGGLSAFVRGVRLVRLVRVLRIFRIAEHVVRNKGRAPEFDIMLKNGTLMRKIPEPRLLSLDAKAQVEYYTRRQLRQHTQSTADGLEHKDSASLMGFVRKASTRGSTSPSQSTRKISCDAISNEDDGARERVAREALKKFQRFEEGTPIEVRVTARIFSKQTAKYLALGGESQRVVVWQYDMTAEQVASCRSMPFEDMDQQSKYMRHESMSRSGNRVSLSVGKDGKMVSREKQARMKHAHPFTQTVNCVSLSADGRRLAGGDANGVVIVYDLDSRCELFRWTDPSQILGVDLSMSGDRLGICGDSKTARMFHVPTGAPIFERVTKDRLRSVRVSSDGRMMATGFEGQLHVSYVDHGARYHSFELGETIRSISTDFAGLIVAMGCEDGRVAVYDLGLEGRIEPIWVVNHSKKVWVVAVSPNGFFVAAGDYANHVCVYEARSGIPVWTKTSWDGKGAPFTWGLSWSGDSSVLAIGRWDTYAYLVDAKNWACVASVKRGDRVYCVSLDHLGQRVAVGGHDRIASVYSISQEKSSAKWQVKDIFSVELDASIYSIALSMDGRQ